MPKKVSKEVSNKVPEEPSTESTESVETLNTEEFDQKYLDLDQLLFHLVTLRKFKRSAEDWVRDLNELLEDKEGMNEYYPSTQSTIKYYVEDLKLFSDKIMKAVTKIKKVAKCDLKKYIYY